MQPMRSVRARSKNEEGSAKMQPLDREHWIKREPVTKLGQRIVSATVEEFAAKGVLGARVAEITRRAGTTDPAFYRYFAGMKQAALFVMSEYYWAPLNLRMKYYRQITSDPVRLFIAAVTALIQSAADDPRRPWLAESKVFRIVVAEMRNPALLPESMLNKEYLDFVGTLEEILRRGQQKRLFSAKLPPAVLAQLLVGTLHSLLMLNNLVFQPTSVKTDEVREVARQLIGLPTGAGIKSRAIN
jgi:AcrR family transcriptional regulator